MRPMIIPSPFPAPPASPSPLHAGRGRCLSTLSLPHKGGGGACMGGGQSAQAL
jgi:hypothetical protein